MTGTDQGSNKTYPFILTSRRMIACCSTVPWRGKSLVLAVESVVTQLHRPEIVHIFRPMHNVRQKVDVTDHTQVCASLQCLEQAHRVPIRLHTDISDVGPLTVYTGLLAQVTDPSANLFIFHDDVIYPSNTISTLWAGRQQVGDGCALSFSGYPVTGTCALYDQIKAAVLPKKYHAYLRIPYMHAEEAYFLVPVIESWSGLLVERAWFTTGADLMEYAHSLNTLAWRTMDIVISLWLHERTHIHRVIAPFDRKMHKMHSGNESSALRKENIKDITGCYDRVLAGLTTRFAMSNQLPTSGLLGVCTYLYFESENKDSTLLHIPKAIKQGGLERRLRQQLDLLIKSPHLESLQTQ